jgi:hypothetical protein
MSETVIREPQPVIPIEHCVNLEDKIHEIHRGQPLFYNPVVTGFQQDQTSSKWQSRDMFKQPYNGRKTDFSTCYSPGNISGFKIGFDNF